MGKFRLICALFLVAILGGLDASPTPIFWRRNSTPSHPPSTTIVGRPHHHYHPQPVIRPGLPQAVAQHPHIHGQGSHIHGQGLPGHIHGQGHIHSRPKPPLVGAHHGTRRHVHHIHQLHG